MIIINEYPPNIKQIKEAFPLKGREIFAWGGTIYSPSGVDIPVWLIEHEKVHFKQQKHIGGPEAWWERYLVDTQFRFEQELEAHQVEYRAYCRQTKDRNMHIRYLLVIARRLASPMYGSVVDARGAMKAIARKGG